METKAKKYEKINFDDVKGYKANDNVELEEELVEEVEMFEEETEYIPETSKGLTQREVETIKTTVGNMTDEEQNVSLTAISSEKLWVELRRRNALYQEKIENFNSIMGVSLNTINPIPEASWIGMIDRYSDIEVRFNEIARVMGV